MAVSIEKDDSPNCVQQCRVLYGVFRKKPLEKEFQKMPEMLLQKK